MTAVTSAAAFTGEVALVTGSSRGIGRGIALGLAQHGADVAVNYRRDRAAAEEVVDEIRGMGRRAAAFQADVADAKEAARLVAEVAQALDPVGLLVNNVGDFFFRPLAAMTAEQWRHVLESNLSSAFYCSLAVLPEMRRRRRGGICNIGLSPTALVRGAPHVAAYAIAKTGIQILTRSLAVEEARFGIRVNCVSPGLIDNGYLPSDQEEWMRRRVPVGRLGRPDEIAEAVAFLLSDRAAYISGANLAVSGAWDWEDRPTGHDHIVDELFAGEEAS